MKTFMIILFSLFVTMIIMGIHLAVDHDSVSIPAPDSPAKTTTAPEQRITPKTEIWRVSAYCAGECCCGRYADYQTASGHDIKHGDKFIAAPKEIPFGTWIQVPGYNDGKPAEVLDRGGAIKGKRLDIFFEDDEIIGCTGHQKALEWGVKYLPIKRTW